MTSGSPVSEARQALERVLASRSFARAEQLRRLLSYLVEAALSGREDTLKETVIGVDVFELATDFDPKKDPVVRMGMRRLRNRLQQYYQSDGAKDPTVISLDPGRYIPRFLPGVRGPHRVSIAVLPFCAASGAESETGGFLREALLSRFGENECFHLVSSESAFAAASSADLEAPTRQTRVQFILGGSCALSGGTMHVLLELFAGESGEAIWQKAYEHDASAEIWVVQNEIVSEIERQVLAHLGQQAKNNSANSSPQGLYRLLVQGRYYLNENTRESLKKSAQCFAAVVEKQPASATAWAGLSVAQIWMAMYHLQPAEQTWRRATLAAERAVSLDATLPEGRLALGLLATLSQFKPAEAGDHFALVLSANPENNTLRLANAMTHLVPLGRLEEAEDQVEAVLASDPLNPKALQMMALIAYFERRYETALELCLSALDILPRSIVASFTLANCYERIGNKEEALKHFRRCEELMPLLKLLKWSSVVAAVYKGRTKWVRPTVLAAARLLQASPRAPSGMIADVLIRIGENESAVTWMERAFREKAFRALFLAVDPAFDAILPDRRCVALLRELQQSPTGRSVEG